MPDAVLDERTEVFERSMAEVQLLLDYVAGRSGKTLGAPPDPAGAAAPGMIKELADAARLYYDPPPDEPSRAAASLTLLQARDQLSNLAYPARALTIAYSAMFSGVVRLPPMRHWAARAVRQLGRPQEQHPDEDAANRQYGRSLLALSTRAYPGLVGNARKFRLACLVLGVFTLAFLLFTAFTYWDVAYGRTLIQRIDAAEKDLGTLARATNPPSDDACAKSERAAAADCVLYRDAKQRASQAREDLQAFATCDGIRCAAHVLHWGIALCGYHEMFAAIASQPANEKLRHPNPEYIIAPVIAVFGTYVLPMMFGYIGTFTSAFRTIRDRMRDYTLSPQDFVMVLMSVPTGIIAGVAVGLFYPVPEATAGANAFATSLTAGGVAFLAGYAAEAFFKVLDSLPERVFRPPPAPPPAQPTPPR